MAHARLRPRLLVDEPRVGASWDVERRSRVNLSGLACKRIEDLFAHFELRPGCSLTVQDLQNLTESGTVDCHHEVLEAVASRSVTIAIEAADDAMEWEIDPAELDCSVSPTLFNLR
jgi:hypothetical protein